MTVFDKTDLKTWPPLYQAVWAFNEDSGLTGVYSLTEDDFGNSQWCDLKGNVFLDRSDEYVGAAITHWEHINIPVPNVPKNGKNNEKV